MAGFEIEEHTADVAVVATGADLSGALAWLAKGMFSIIAELEHVRPRETLEFSVSARDPESLAVDWLNEVLNRGASWAVDRGLGDPDDIEVTEESGCMQDTGADAVGERPRTRGGPQLGTLGSGNHFLEVQVVDELLDGRSRERDGTPGGRPGHRDDPLWLPGPGTPGVHRLAA